MKLNMSPRNIIFNNIGLRVIEQTSYPIKETFIFNIFELFCFVSFPLKELQPYE